MKTFEPRENSFYIRKMDSGDDASDFNYINAIPFYEKNGFKILSDADAGSNGTRMLFFDLKMLG